MSASGSVQGLPFCKCLIQYESDEYVIIGVGTLSALEGLTL